MLFYLSEGVILSTDKKRKRMPSEYRKRKKKHQLTEPLTKKVTI